MALLTAKEAQLATCKFMKAYYPELCGVTLQRGLVERVNLQQAVVEILHITNFRREKFGYSQHRKYQDYLDSEARDWSPALHEELIQTIKRSGLTPKEANLRTEKKSDEPDQLPDGFDEVL